MFIVGLCVVGCSSTTALIVLIGAIVMSGSHTAGAYVAVVDMAPNHAGNSGYKKNRLIMVVHLIIAVCWSCFIGVTKNNHLQSENAQRKITSQKLRQLSAVICAYNKCQNTLYKLTDTCHCYNSCTLRVVKTIVINATFT